MGHVGYKKNGECYADLKNASLPTVTHCSPPKKNKKNV
jgi:hypothetical protein